MALSAEQRRAIYDRDAGCCGFCGELVPFERMDLDHMQPQSRGGSDEPVNLRPAHRRCNRRAGGLLGGAAGRHGPRDVPEDRLNMRLDAKTIVRLRALEARMELRRPDLIRLAVRALAEREGVETDAPER